MQNILEIIQQFMLEASVGDALADGYQCVSAQRIAAQYYPQVDLSLPLLITNLETLATPLKLILLNAYPTQHPVTILSGDTRSGQTYATITLDALDQAVPLTSTSIVYLPPLHPASFSALQAIVAHLRAPEGCPWDRAQTLVSMRHDLLGECAEVLEAIDAEASGQNNSPHIAEELGDLLMAAVLMIQIATEEKRFQMADVINGVVTKLIRRHPHVFGDTIVDGVQSVLTNWDAIKAQEKLAKGQRQPDPLDGVPAGLPALEKARQLQSKAAKAGLLDRVVLSQTTPELATLLGAAPTEARLGEILWQLVAFAQTVDLNPEDALRNYTVQFRQAARRRD
ncbi:MAG: MazG family protein [Chloroflexi bacterium]|nr:MazG family protein [Chloroflexota bacterium]